MRDGTGQSGRLMTACDAYVRAELVNTAGPGPEQLAARIGSELITMTFRRQCVY